MTYYELLRPTTYYELRPTTAYDLQRPTPIYHDAISAPTLPLLQLLRARPAYGPQPTTTFVRRPITTLNYDLLPRAYDLLLPSI